MNANPTLRGVRGFSTLQLIVTLAIISVVSAFAVVGIGSARASMRLSASERELAAYLEQARTDSIRRHASAPTGGEPDIRATVSVPADGGTTYSVTLDFDKDGVLDAPRSVRLQDGVTFTGVAHNVAFDWRGRTASEVSIGLINERGTTGNINITGSGDITLNTEVFQDDDIPDVALNNTNVNGDVILDEAGVGIPEESTIATPTPEPYASPSPTASPTPNPTASPTPTPSVLPTVLPTPNVYPTPTPTSTPTPAATPTPTPVPCSISVSPSSLSLAQNGASTIYVTLSNYIGSGTVTATSSHSGQIQVSPSSRAVTGSGTVGFTVTVKRNNGSVAISTSPNCGSQTVAITVN